MWIATIFNPELITLTGSTGKIHHINMIKKCQVEMDETEVGNSY